MTATQNKSLTELANGADVNTWDVPTNANWATVDTALGGVTSLNVTGQGGTISLNLAQYTPPIILVSGTLTANINYQLPLNVGGFWFINNATTGAFAVEFSYPGGGQAVFIPQGNVSGIYMQLVVGDGVNLRNQFASYLLPNNNPWTGLNTFSNGVDVTTIANDHGVRIRSPASGNAILQFTNNAGAQLATLQCTAAGIMNISGALNLGAGLVVPGNAGTPEVAVTFSPTAMSVNCELSNVFTTTLAGNVTTAPSILNAGNGQTINWILTQDATGSRAMTWPSNFKWPGGTKGVLSTAPNSVDVLVATSILSKGSWYATLVKGFA